MAQSVALVVLLGVVLVLDLLELVLGRVLVALERHLALGLALLLAELVLLVVIIVVIYIVAL